jgi:hypothetical protein
MSAGIDTITLSGFELTLNFAILYLDKTQSLDF